MAKYAIEIWSKDGIPIADIRQICTSFSWSKTLNGSESVGFTVDLKRLEDILKASGYANDPFGFMEVGRCDIRIKRDGKYIVGANIYRFNYTSSYNSITMRVECVGYLNFYKTQYISAEYTNTPQQDIMWDVIARCNEKNGGDYGIRRGTHSGDTVYRDRSYERKEVASLITQMSNVINGCDFEFTPDKLFNTYQTKGTYRPSVRAVYPGNIQSFNFTRTLDKVANYVYGIGSGTGEEAVQSQAEDPNSEDYLYRREKISIWNSVTDQTTIDEHTDSVLHAGSEIIELPNITMRDNAFDMSELDVGDTIKVELGGFASISHVSGDYRITGIVCDVDDNDSESVTLDFDGLDIEQKIQNQESENNG